MTKASAINNAQLVEIIIPGLPGGNTSTRIQITDQPYLRDTNTWSLETFNIGDIPKTLANNDVVTLAQMKGMFLTLYTNDATPGGSDNLGQYIQQVPLIRLHNMQNAATDAFERMPFNLVGQRLQWDKCELNLVTALNNTTNISVLLLVNFTFINNK